MSIGNNSHGTTPRIIFIGDSGVGKTSIIHRIKTGAFLENSAPTIGAGVTTFDAVTERGNETFQMWDTAGQEVYRNIIPIYFKGADAAVVVFACNDRQSFENLQSWLDELHSNTDADIITVIAGNKCELDHVKSEPEVKKWCQARNLVNVFVSAKTGQGIDVLTEEIVGQYIARKVLQKIPDAIELSSHAYTSGCC